MPTRSILRHLATAALSVFSAYAACTLPIEVLGPNGTTEFVTVILPAGQSAHAQTLWLQMHGLEYNDIASVQINHLPWLSLNNKSVDIAEPGRSYGGIGGGFATLQLTLPLPEGALQEGDNVIRFRFNQTNGISSGFRVLAFNFIDQNGHRLLPAETFTQELPDQWKPPLDTPSAIAAGATLWNHATLQANGLPQARPIRAHCADCHAADGRDLKYFNYSNASVIARARFHGLSQLEGEQIASYIRSLPVPNPGRPWNPPYQPGPGLDTAPIEDWAAGAGLSAVLATDRETLPYLFPHAISAAAFRPDGDLHSRAIPIVMQLPDWNHWLPRIHPLDAWGSSFDHSRFASTQDNFDQWAKSRHQFLTRLTAHTPSSPELTDKIYSTQLWQLVKTWEITQARNLEANGRTWTNNIPALTAPAATNIPDGPNGMGGSALTNEYYTSAWYELQLQLNDGNHRHHDQFPINWPYFIDSFLNLYRQTSHPEPARLLIAVIRAIQSTDPAIGPQDLNHGWRPETNIDPRILVDQQWALLFQTLTPAEKIAITDAFLTAWLDKNTQYRGAEYFQRGVTTQFFSHTYTAPDEVRAMSGGSAWTKANEFQAAGIRPELIQRLTTWGENYRNLAQLYHY